MVRKRYKFRDRLSQTKRDAPGTSRGNRFQAMSDADDNMDAPEEDEISVADPPIRIPPIVVDAKHHFTTVMQIVGRNSDYRFKRMSIGTKIECDTLEDYKRVNDVLTAAKFEFFSHPIKDPRAYKLVVFGLPVIPIDEIRSELKENYCVDILNIREIKTKRSTKNDALYIIEFSRDSIAKKDVMKIKYICKVRVDWRNPQKRKGPTQCTISFMYGHGASNCHRKNVCPACSGSHDFSECNMKKTQNDGPIIYRCFNCIKRGYEEINHRADNSICPCREDYLELKRKLTGNNSRPSTEVFSNANSRPSSSGIKQNVSYADATRSSNNSNSKMYSIDQLFDIFTNAMEELEKCKNSHDQIKVIGNLLKYASK